MTEEVKMKLTNLRLVGRYINPATGKPVNVRKGRQVGRSVDILFYTYRGSRHLINARDFFNNWKP